MKKLKSPQAKMQAKESAFAKRHQQALNTLVTIYKISKIQGNCTEQMNLVKEACRRYFT